MLVELVGSGPQWSKSIDPACTTSIEYYNLGIRTSKLIFIYNIMLLHIFSIILIPSINYFFKPIYSAHPKYKKVYLQKIYK